MTQPFPKIVGTDSFDWDDISLSSLCGIVDDPVVFRKTASANLTKEWGDVKPIKGHTLLHIIALSDFEKTGSNRNGDAFEEWFCQKIHPTFMTKAALYENHNTRGSGDLKKGYVVKSGHNDVMGRTELIIAANNEKCASWLSKMERGEPTAFSMGLACLLDVCSICDHHAGSPSDYCGHVKKKASAPYGLNKVLPDGRKCFVYNRKGYFNDISHVNKGADMTAFAMRKVAHLALESGAILSGHDLADIYGIEYGTPATLKIAMFEALANEERHSLELGMMDFTENPCVKTAHFRGDADFRDVLSSLTRDGVVLPMKTFFKMTYGDSYGEVEGAVDGIMSKAASLGMFTWAAENGHTEDICSNETYHSNDKVGNILSSRDSQIILAGASIPVYSGCSFYNKTAGMDYSPQEATLLNQYLAYRVSACERCPAMLSVGDRLFNIPPH